MRILIVEDEPLIAMDLEDILHEASDVDCVWARDVADGLMQVARGVDFALLDFDLGHQTSLPVALRLQAEAIPFCFVSGSLSDLPPALRRIPSIAKPFRPADIHRLLAAAA
ncbi:response regulator [Aureimonas ureilytica]|uniref:response regulator n=1 Tax=Aureimonas ureilytica TaxID=401562 RepID=UPI003CEB3CD2